MKYVDFMILEGVSTIPYSADSGIVGRYHVPRRKLGGYDYNTNQYKAITSGTPKIGDHNPIGNTSASYTGIWRGTRDHSLVKGTSLDLTLKISFNAHNPGVPGLYGVFMRTIDRDNRITGWEQVGTYLVSNPDPTKATLMARTRTKEAVFNGAKWRFSTDAPGVTRPLGIPFYSSTAGPVTVEFLETERYYPKYATKTVNLNFGQTADAPADYLLKGKLRVMLNNLDLDQGGWKLSTETNWRENGKTIYLKQGTYTIEFKDVPGYTTPLSTTVAIYRGQTAHKYWTYEVE